MVLYWSFWQLSTWLYCLMVLTLALQGLYGNSGLLHRCILRGKLQDEWLKESVDEETRWAIDYLIPYILANAKAGS